MSSLLGRILRREAASKINWAYSTNKNAPPTYVPEMIRNKVWLINDLSHLEMTARYDPIGKYVTHGMADACFDDWFTFVDADGEEVLEEAQQQLKVLNAKRAFTQVLAAERVFGYAWLYTGKNRFIPEGGEGGRIASLYCFTPMECSVWEYTDNGNPKTMKIELTVGRGGGQDQEVLYLPAEDFILWNTRPIGRGYTGRSVLEPIWERLVELRYTIHSMTFYDMKIGHGALVAYSKAGFGEDALAKWQSAFEDMSNKRAIVVDEGQVSRIEFVGAASQATDFENHIKTLLEQIAIGLEMPVDLLKGASAGGVVGSETNLKLGEIQERKIQKDIEEYIREVVERMGFYREYDIDWNVKYAQDEEEQAKIAQTTAQAYATKLSFMTIDEVRNEYGLAPLPDGRGDMLASETSAFNIDVQGLQSPEQQDKTQNPEGVQT